ncbi:hypothetical protein ACA910_005866 [Epithemia clementina (nom. ined.)]
MVIAELPLWVTHRDTSSSAASKQSQPTGLSSPPLDRTTTSTTTSNDNDNTNNNTTTALSSLSLLQDDRHKCAIYSIDVHPRQPKFATAGGDGTVRVWSTTSLFCPHYRGGRFDERAGYISTSDDDDGDGDDGDDENNSASAAGNTTEEESSRRRDPAQPQPKRNAATTIERGVVSNSENEEEDDDDDEEEEDDEKKKDKMEIDSKRMPEKGDGGMEINDLNQLVRRKSSTTTQTLKPPPALERTNQNDKTSSAATAAATTTPNSGEPPSKPQSTATPSNNHNKADHHPAQQRLLCTLSAHTGSSVLCVRWSPRGNYLASAGDDGCVCIYAPATQVGGGAAVAAVGNLVNHAGDGTSATLAMTEQWSRILLCRGHNLDVVGLAWAPDDSHLVSCSLDRETPILIWKLTDLARGEIPDAHQRIRQPYKVLGKDVHTSTVKGVTFDPAGSYLASSGDDPSVCIWRAHDDWGLEQRIDASTGIFRQWKENDSISMSAQSLFRRISWATDGSYICSTNSVVKNKNVASTIARDGWAVATDPSSHRGTGAATLVGHKQPIVASRHASQWLDVSKKSKTEKSNNGESDAGNNPDDAEEDDDEEPEYATLLALGDKSGFVTVWSTRKSKPVFKLQCSESRCTVTDLAWGEIDTSGHMMLLISLLDGQVVAIKFHVPNELGPLLSEQGQAKVFQMRYGIDLMQIGGGDPSNDNLDNDWHGRSRSGMTVGERAGPQLIENAIQMSLERQQAMTEQENGNAADGDDDEPMAPPPHDSDDDNNNQMSISGTGDGTTQQRSAAASTSTIITTTKGGKKRVQPVLLSGNAGIITAKQPRIAAEGRSSSSPRKQQQQQPKAATDTLQDALAAADRAEALTAGRSAIKRVSPQRTQHSQQQQPSQQPQEQQPRSDQSTFLVPGSSFKAFSAIPHSTERIHSIDLPASTMLEATSGLTAECINVRVTPPCSRSGSSALLCIDLSITQEGRVVWRDEIPGATCTATSASTHYWVVGTSDGILHLYGTSPSMGWQCGQAFRIMAPLVLGYPIVELKLQQEQQQQQPSSGTMSDPSSSATKTTLFTVIGDGSFFVFNIEPELKLEYKGSILPAMNHVLLGLPTDINEHPTPALSNAHITKQGHLTILISLQRASARAVPTSTSAGRGMSNTNNNDSSRNNPNNSNNNKRVRNTINNPSVDHGAGGSIQGFVYNRTLELWTRMSDSRFICSDYYQMLPSSLSSPSPRRSKIFGPLSELDNSVRMGTLGSSLKPSGRPSSESALVLFSRSTLEGDDDDNNDKNSKNSKALQQNFIPTRSHCEDRIACALQLGSAREVRHWLLKYILVLILGGHEATLRVVIDMILDAENKSSSSSSTTANSGAGKSFISCAVRLLGQDPVVFVRDEILRQMGKNRSLQRLASEVQLEVNDMD